VALCLEAFDGGADLGLRDIAVCPTRTIHVLAGFEVLVAAEEVLDRVERELVDVRDALDVVPAGVSGGYGEHLVVTAGLVIHLEHDDGADVDAHTVEQRLGKAHEHVVRVTVVSAYIPYEAIIVPILHHAVEIPTYLDSSALIID